MDKCGKVAEEKEDRRKNQRDMAEVNRGEDEEAATMDQVADWHSDF